MFWYWFYENRHCGSSIVPEAGAPEVDTPELVSPEADVTHVQINIDKDSDTNYSTDADNSTNDVDYQYYTVFPKMLSNQTDARIPPKNVSQMGDLNL